MDHNEPRVAYTTNNENQAEVIRMALEAEGIKCQVNGKSQAGLVGSDALAVEIVVRAADYDHARAFIQSHLKNA